MEKYEKDDGSRLNRGTLVTKIRDYLRDQILSGVLLPGARLTENGLANLLGTSAGPIREAFAALTVEGLLISLPHRGTFVSSISKDEARDAYLVRSRLEPLAAEMTMVKMTADISKEIDDGLEDLRIAALSGDYFSMIPIDMMLHGLLFKHSGNVMLASIWPLLEVAIRKIVVVAGPQYDRDLDGIVQEHQILFKCIEAGDITAVRQLLADHGRDLWNQMDDKT